MTGSPGAPSAPGPSSGGGSARPARGEDRPRTAGSSWAANRGKLAILLVAVVALGGIACMLGIVLVLIASGG